MKALKIAMVTGTFPAISETFVVNQIIALKKLGMQVDVFCFRQSALSLENHSQDYIKSVSVLNWQHYMPASFLSRINQISQILIKAIKAGLFFNLLASALFKKQKVFNTHLFFKYYYQHLFTIENYDVLHIHFGTNAIELLTQIQHFKKKVVVTFHGFDVHKFDAAYYNPLKLLSKVTYTVNTKYTEQKVINLGFSKGSITILPVGLDTDFFKPNKQAHNTFNIIFVGRLISLKGPLLSIKIVHRLINDGLDNVILYIIGDGALYQECQNYINQHQLEKYIMLEGNKTQHDIKNRMNECDVFLFPGIVDASGRCEAQGLVVQEAQSMQLPAVISNVGGLPEGILNGSTGFVVDAENIQAFASVLKNLHQNRAELNKMSIAARTYVTEQYNHISLAEELIQSVYQV